MTVSPLDRLDVASARRLRGHTQIVVANRVDNSEIERVTLLRYAGHYRSGRVHAFAIKDSQDKFRVRSERSLGLAGESDRVAYVAAEFDSSRTDAA